MTKESNYAWEYAGIKTCINQRFTTHYNSRGVETDVRVEYSCQKCGWKPTDQEMNGICFDRDYQPLTFHAAMCEEIPPKTAADIEADNISYGDGYGGD